MRDNVNEDASNLRDTFLMAERDYVKELLQVSGIRELIYECTDQPSELLFKAAQKIVDDVEAGKVPDELMERTEQQLTVLLAAIQDKVLIKDLVLLPDIEERHSKSR